MKGKDRIFRILIAVSTITFFGLIAGMTWTTYDHMARQVNLRKWVLHTQEVLMAVSRLENAIKDIQIYEQLYGLTNKLEYYNAFKESRQRLLQSLKSATELIDDNESQITKLKELETKVKGRLNYLDAHIEHLKAGREYLVTKDDFDRLGQTGLRIRAVLKDIEQEEMSLLKQRSDRLEEATHESFMRMQIISAGAFLVFMLAIAALYSINKTRARESLSREVTHMITSVLSRRINLADAVPECFKIICQYLGWKTAALWCPTTDGKSLYLHTFYSDGEGDASNFERATRSLSLADGQSKAERAWRNSEAAWVYMDGRDPDFLRIKEAQEDGLKSGYVLPVHVQEKFIGVFEFFSQKDLKSDEHEEWLLKVVCGDLAQEIERKKAEVGLQDALSELALFHKFLDSVLQNMGSGVVVADKEGNFLLFNDAAEKILGYGAGAVGAKADWSEVYGLFEEDGVTPLVENRIPLARAIKGQSVDDFIIYCKNERILNGLWISVNGRPIFNDNGEVYGGVVVFEDVTSRKEEERRTLELYSMVSHELRTPLTSIRGALGLLEGGKAGVLSDRAKHLVTMGRRECERLVRLINDILDVQKIDAGRLQLKLSEVEPVKLIERATENLRALADEKRVILSFESNTTAPGLKIQADKDRFLQVITNLISNAIKFAPEKSEVKVKLEKEESGKQILVSVTDQGPGISEENQAKLFRSFQQVGDHANNPNEGTGLGLSISKALVKLHHGNIGIKSKEGEGATFWFSLPSSQPV